MQTPTLIYVYLTHRARLDLGHYPSSCWKPLHAGIYAEACTKGYVTLDTSPVLTTQAGADLLRAWLEYLRGLHAPWRSRRVRDAATGLRADLLLGRPAIIPADIVQRPVGKKRFHLGTARVPECCGRVVPVAYTAYESHNLTDVAQDVTIAWLCGQLVPFGGEVEFSPAPQPTTES